MAATVLLVCVGGGGARAYVCVRVYACMSVSKCYPNEYIRSIMMGDEGVNVSSYVFHYCIRCVLDGE